MTAVVPDFAQYKYTLPESTIKLGADVVVPQDAAGLITTLRTYSTNGKETWHDISRRVVEGAWSIHKWHKTTTGNGLEPEQVDKFASDMYLSMLRLQWCPAGRGLQHMGHPRMWIKGAGILNSCAFISTARGLPPALGYLADMSMLGVGVGFDTEGAYQGFTVSTPPLGHPDVSVEIDDSREGWVEALVSVARAFCEGSELFNMYTGGVRKKGEPLHTMGGVSSGPAPLIEAILSMVKVFDAGITATFREEEELIVFEAELNEAGAPVEVIKGLSSQIISDVMNIGGKCIVSGGLRRSAELGLFRDGDEFPYTAKLEEEQFNDFRWAANNTVSLWGWQEASKFSRMLDTCCLKGDPGALLMGNIMQQGRTGELCERETHAIGCNPCGEQNLEDGECCNLVEQNLPRIPTEELPYVSCLSFLYGKLVSLLPFHREDINEVVRRNRRIGVGLTGVVEVSPDEYTDKVFDDAYNAIEFFDRMISSDLCVPTSIKHTTVKPSGTVSLVLGVSPGINEHFAEFYLRRINIERSSPLVKWLSEAGYQLPDNIYTTNSVVVEIPMEATGPTRSSAIDQLKRVSRMQRVWSDNMVSNTIVFEDHEKAEMAEYLEAHQSEYKSLSFLRRQNEFQQPVLEEITEEVYRERLASLKPLSVERLWEIAEELGGEVHEVDDKFCEGDRCAPSWVEA